MVQQQGRHWRGGKTTPPAMWHGKAEPSVEDGDQPRMVERIG